MSDETTEKKRIAYISYLDEKNLTRDGYFELIKFDSSFITFKSHDNIITIPTIRLLKMKEKEDIL